LVETQAILPAGETTLQKETEPAKNDVLVPWSPYRFEEQFPGILAILSVVSLVGAIGFTAMLFFYALSH
jgi:hypothetical protein